MVDLWRLGVTIYMVAVLWWMVDELEKIGRHDTAGVVLAVGFIGVIISFVGSLNRKKVNPMGSTSLGVPG